MNQQFLEKVYGYKEVKKELKTIQDWYFNYESLGERRKMLPKGILFYGEPGEGKTHMVREYSKSFGYPTFVIEGNDDNVLDEVVKTYEKASKEKNAIVVIDEIDRLIEKDDKLTRILMAQLDGFKTSTVLTLATCNYYFSIPEALRRPGRFDRHLQLFISDDSDLLDVIRGFSTDAGIKLNENDETELLETFYHCTPSYIKFVFNNVALRFNHKWTIADIINTADFLETGFLQKNEDFKIKRSTAIHEAGHAVYLYLFCKTKKFLRIFFDHKGGHTACRSLSQYQSREGKIDKVKAALSGMVAEDIVMKKHEIGCEDDLERAYDTSYFLMNEVCLDGVKNYCSLNMRECCSDNLKRVSEQHASVYLRKNYRIVRKQLRRYKNKIIQVADVLMKNKEIKRNEFVKIMEEK